jgi:hypothetical protein
MENHQQTKRGLFYTYFGEGGAAAIAFLIIASLFTCIYLFISVG